MSGDYFLITYLKCDVSLRPVLEVGEQQVGVSVDKVDADQLLAARPPELRRTLTEGPSSTLHARGVVLTVSQLAQRQRRGVDFTQLTATGGMTGLFLRDTSRVARNKIFSIKLNLHFSYLYPSRQMQEYPFSSSKH